MTETELANADWWAGFPKRPRGARGCGTPSSWLPDRAWAWARSDGSGEYRWHKDAPDSSQPQDDQVLDPPDDLPSEFNLAGRLSERFRTVVSDISLASTAAVAGELPCRGPAAMRGFPRDRHRIADARHRWHVSLHSARPNWTTRPATSTRRIGSL